MLKLLLLDKVSFGPTVGLKWDVAAERREQCVLKEVMSGLQQSAVNDEPTEGGSHKS